MNLFIMQTLILWKKKKYIQQEFSGFNALRGDLNVRLKMESLKGLVWNSAQPESAEIQLHRIRRINVTARTHCEKHIETFFKCFLLDFLPTFNILVSLWQWNKNIGRVFQMFSFRFYSNFQYSCLTVTVKQEY